MGCFAEGLHNGNSLFAELIGAMRSIEFAISKNWRNFWLETGSMLVAQAFKSLTLFLGNLETDGATVLALFYP